MAKNNRYVYGHGPVRELISSRAATVVVVYVTESKGKGAEIMRLARDRRVEVEEVNRQAIDQFAPGVNHQGVVAIAGEYQYADVDDMLDLAERRNQPALLVAADCVTDPHNLGAIMRSAYLLGAHGVIIPRNRAAGVTSVATKVSAGASEHLAVAQVTNLSRVLTELKQSDIWTAAAVGGNDSIAPHQLDGTMALCLVVGSEGAGIRKHVHKQCDFSVGIPMAGKAVGSFNVSVATSVLLYEVARQRAAAT